MKGLVKNKFIEAKSRGMAVHTKTKWLHDIEAHSTPDSNILAYDLTLGAQP